MLYLNLLKMIMMLTLNKWTDISPENWVHSGTTKNAIRDKWSNDKPRANSKEQRRGNTFIEKSKLGELIETKTFLNST